MQINSTLIPIKPLGLIVHGLSTFLQSSVYFVIFFINLFRLYFWSRMFHVPDFIDGQNKRALRLIIKENEDIFVSYGSSVRKAETEK